MKGTGFMTMVLLVFLLLSAFPGCAPAPDQPQPTVLPPAPAPAPPISPTPTPTASGPSRPVQAKLTISEPPVLGKPVQLTFTLTLFEGRGITEAKDTSVKIILPEGFELVSASAEEKVDVMQGPPAQFQATVKSIKTGRGTIEGRAIYYSPGSVGNIGVASASLYVSVSEDGAEVSDTPISPKEIPRAMPALPPAERGITIPEPEPGTVKPQPRPPTPSSPTPQRG